EPPKPQPEIRPEQDAGSAQTQPPTVPGKGPGPVSVVKALVAAAERKARDVDPTSRGRIEQLVREIKPAVAIWARRRASRLAEAYEVLSNASARREYDNVTQYGEEIGGPLRAGMEAMERGELKAAQTAFQHVLSQRPDLHFARDLLGMACLNNNQPREALKH